MVSKLPRRSNRDFRGKDSDKSPATSAERTSGSDHSSVEPTRHTEFWLHDGSIVLSVQETLFRVHQTILANHSEVFADLFRLPQPTEDAEKGEMKEGSEMQKIDGCHVVHLQDDADDFVDLLKAIYYPSYASLYHETHLLYTEIFPFSGISTNFHQLQTSMRFWLSSVAYCD
jgi:BTB/POZ domain